MSHDLNHIPTNGDLSRAVCIESGKDFHPARPSAPSTVSTSSAEATILPQLLELLHEGVCFVDLKNRIRSWNPAAERITGYQKDEVVGHTCYERIFQHNTCHGMSACAEHCPSHKAVSSGCRQEADLFLHHKAGHRVPVTLRVAPLIGQGGNIIGSMHSFVERRQVLAAIEHAMDFERFTFIDPLTQVGNRRYTEVAFAQAFEAFQRYGRRPGLMLIDVDRLSAVNRNFGTEAGDLLLRAVTRTISQCLRSYDYLGRWADDQFYAILADTHSDHLVALAEQCRAQVCSSRIPVGAHCLDVSVSLGASLLVPNDTPDSWRGRAERNLREAKFEGGNRVIGDPMNTLFNWFHPAAVGE